MNVGATRQRGGVGNKARKAVVVGGLRGIAGSGQGCARAVGALRRTDPERVVIAKDHLRMRAVRDGVRIRDGVGGQAQQAEGSSEQACASQLLAGEVQRGTVRKRGRDAAGNGNRGWRQEAQ